jgi:hypothetical protein
MKRFFIPDDESYSVEKILGGTVISLPIQSIGNQMSKVSDPNHHIFLFYDSHMDAGLVSDTLEKFGQVSIINPINDRVYEVSYFDSRDAVDAVNEMKNHLRAFRLKDIIY